jgi:hypothetical protein
LQYDWRFGALVRLVKAWARRFDVNDSANGSLNSFALTLMVREALSADVSSTLPRLARPCSSPAPGLSFCPPLHACCLLL